MKTKHYDSEILIQIKHKALLMKNNINTTSVIEVHNNIKNENSGIEHNVWFILNNKELYSAIHNRLYLLGNDSNSDEEEKAIMYYDFENNQRGVII